MFLDIIIVACSVFFSAIEGYTEFAEVKGNDIPSGFVVYEAFGGFFGGGLDFGENFGEFFVTFGGAFGTKVLADGGLSGFEFFSGVNLGKVVDAYKFFGDVAAKDGKHVFAYGFASGTHIDHAI